MIRIIREVYFCYVKRYIRILDQSDIDQGIILGYSDTLRRGRTAIRSEIKARRWVLTPIPTPAVRRPNNSGERLEKG